MLANAAMQRKAIGLSNVLFDWDCYPTFYGSKFAVCPGDKRLFDIPEKTTEAALVPLYATAETLETFAKRNSSKRMFLYLVPDNQNISDAPVISLVDNALSYPHILTVFQATDVDVTVIDGGVTYDEFRSGWYKTDHHWNIIGAYNAYLEIAHAMGFKADSTKVDDAFSYEDIQFRGTLSRRSLDDVYFDTLMDIKLDAEESYQVAIDGGETGGSELLVRREVYSSGKQGKNAFTSHYGEYFNFGGGLTVIENTANRSGKELLVIADSFASCIDRFLAEKYETVYVLDPRNSNISASQMLDEHDAITDILVLMCYANLIAQSTTSALS